MITGESKPVKKAPGDLVIGGTINGVGSLRIEVTAVGDETALAGIMRLVEQAQQSKSNTQILADKAEYHCPSACSRGFSAFWYSTFAGSWGGADVAQYGDRGC